jgi:hypothetical protein
MKPPETTDEFFALPIRSTIEAKFEPQDDNTYRVRPVVHKASSYLVTPAAVLIGHDAEGRVFVLGLDEEGYCRRPWT